MRNYNNQRGMIESRPVARTSSAGHRAWPELPICSLPKTPDKCGGLHVDTLYKNTKHEEVKKEEAKRGERGETKKKRACHELNKSLTLMPLPDLSPPPPAPLPPPPPRLPTVPLRSLLSISSAAVASWSRSLSRSLRGPSAGLVSVEPAAEWQALPMLGA